MATVTEEFRYLAKELSELYQKRKELAKDIIFKEDKLRKLGLMLEFVDNLEEKLDDECDGSDGFQEQEV
ncbi:MAG: hypothetical protein HY094_08165 [Candidatus Melainabacteria bacterium]|nr:hypothetical protein [Candidatus Melainabacteria bacterium]